MPMFQYIGEKQRGSVHSGRNRWRPPLSEAIQLLRRQDMLVTHLTEKIRPVPLIRVNGNFLGESRALRTKSLLSLPINLRP